MTPDPLIVDPNSGITVPLGTSRITVKLDAAATGGRFALLDYEVAPDFVAPPVPHGHTRESQTVYVLKGRVRFEFETRIVEAVAGTVLHIPENCTFTWRNPAPEPARMLYVFAPAGFERFFTDVQQIFAMHPTASPADIAPHVARLWAQYGIVS
jgi:mannose-6-phosphate isomerase-like protein (cupin superfamily)